MSSQATLIVYNQTASPLSYLSGSVIIPASGSLSIDIIYKIDLSLDGQFRSDCANNIVQVSDGVTLYGGTDAIKYLTLIGPTITSDVTNDALDVFVVNPVDVNIYSIATPTIVNTVAVLANTEYSYTFPANTKKFIVKSRGGGRLQFAYIVGQSSSNFITIFPGNSYEETGLGAATLTIYFQSYKANETIEILSWV